ncbi:putative F-box protein At3g17620 isoform X2 [Raphanus sativus]|nr:putative F-box protein At3g17620 isoform X2 [Raphanus sativus]
MMKPDDPVVWNPYLGQVRWIKPRRKLAISGSYRYCMGYDNKNNHKILRFLDHDDGTAEHDIYDFKSDSWRVLDLTSDWIILDYREGLSLKGNTYFVAREREVEYRESLICFDFTSERFRHCLDLESNYRNGDTVILSAVREEQLAVLFSRVDTNTIEIRITTKIEANEVSWRNFLKVDVEPSMLRGMFSGFPSYRSSFLVDEKKKVALIYDNVFTSAYMIAENNYSNIVARGRTTCWPPVVCSYVPSSVQIQKGPVHARGKRKLRDF